MSEPQIIYLRASQPQPLQLKFAEAYKTGQIAGYASTFGGEPDSHGDIIAKGAFARSLADIERRGVMPAMLWSHNAGVPVGRWTEMREDARGLLVRGQLNLETEMGKEAHAHAKAGDVTGLSIGFGMVDGGRVHNGDGTKTIIDLDLAEISLVTMPSNRNARLTAVKGLGSQRELQSLLHETGLSRAAAAKIASAGWSALNSDDPDHSETDIRKFVDRLRAATTEIRNLKG